MSETVTVKCVCLTLNIIFVFAFLSIPTDCRKLENTKGEPKIIGGNKTTISKVPYLVNLRQDGYFICGGSLLTPHCVLTAAHCTFGVPASSLTVHAGATKLSEPGKIRRVDKNFVPSFYIPITMNMDVAILKLSSPIVGENVATIPVCNITPSNKQLVKISGWGVSNENNPDPENQVRSVDVPIISKSDCMLAYAGRAHLTGTMFCAGVLGEKDSCSGDSGGPVVYNNEVCGIVSWGIGCATPRYPGVYTNLASVSVKAFMKQVISKNC